MLHSAKLITSLVSFNRNGSFITNRNPPIRNFIIPVLGGPDAGTETPRYHAATPVSYDERPSNHFLLCRRTLHGWQGGRHRPSPDERPRLHFVPAFLARWRAGRVHFAVR